MVKRFLLFLYCSFLSVLILPAQQSTQFDVNRKISVEEMQGDFMVLKAVLEDIHPGLYWYNDEASMDSAFTATYKQIIKPLKEQEFINLLYPVISYIKCGHTQLQNSKAYISATNRPKVVPLPFDVFVKNNQAWIISNRTSHKEVAPGSELLEINDIPVEKILDGAYSWWSSDGNNKSWKEFFLNDYDFFEYYCSAVYNFKPPYKVKIKDQFDRISNIKIDNGYLESPSSFKSEVVNNIPDEQREKERKQTYLNLKILDDSITAVVTVNALEYGDEEYYHQFFEEINKSKIKNLILDIRKNHGGDVRIISNLLSYLADGDFRILKKIIAKKEDPSNSIYAAYFDKHISDSYKSSYKKGIKEGDWYTISTSEEMGDLTAFNTIDEKNHFKGDLYVLIGGGTFSNAANFAAALKKYRKNTIFIGTETGGTEAGCFGGNIQKLELPYSKIIVQIPLFRLINDSVEPTGKNGLIPDYEIQYNPDAIIEKKDLEVERATSLIKEKSN